MHNTENRAWPLNPGCVEGRESHARIHFSRIANISLLSLVVGKMLKANYHLNNSDKSTKKAKTQPSVWITELLTHVNLTHPLVITLKLRSRRPSECELAVKRKRRLSLSSWVHIPAGAH